MEDTIFNSPAAGKVLLVEDNPFDAELTLRALAKHDLAGRVIWVKDGAQALAFFFSPTGDVRPVHMMPLVVFLDIKLPRVSGLEVLQRLKADAHTKMVPVVMLSSSEDDRDLSQAYQYGVNSYVVKPIDFSRFSETLGQLGLYWINYNVTPYHFGLQGGDGI